MFKNISNGWYVYRKNFLRLSVSFCVTAIPIGIAMLSLPRTVEWQFFLGGLFVLSFLGSASFNIKLVDSFKSGNTVTNREALLVIKRNLSRLIELGFLLAALIVSGLYLLLRFYNFVVSLTVLAIPVLTVFTLPRLVLEREGLLDSLKSAMRTSWNNFFDVLVVTMLPGVVVIYLWLIGLWLPVWCFLLPFWVVLITELYLEIKLAD
ncbi:MAG: hypothetical protein ACOC7Z_00350 [Candidatus Bipolaricaulota bacterium]